jgi:hypothetical protein
MKLGTDRLIVVSTGLRFALVSHCLTAQVARAARSDGSRSTTTVSSIGREA